MVNLGEDTLTIIVNYYSQCEGVSSFKNATFKVQTTRLTPISYASAFRLRFLSQTLYNVVSISTENGNFFRLTTSVNPAEKKT